MIQQQEVNINPIQILKRLTIALENIEKRLSDNDSINGEWVNTIGALKILRRKNQRVLKKIREEYLSPNDYRKDGWIWEYKSSALIKLRKQADNNQILLPK